VRVLLGHSSVATTQVYVAVDDDDLTRAAAGAWDAA
jgi:site-specific recombinase XerD